MNFGRLTLVILFAAKIAASLDVRSLNSIEEIIEFVAEVADSINGEKLNAAEKLVNSFRIDGYRNYGEVVRKYFAEFPHKTVTDQQIEELKNYIAKIDNAWIKFTSEEAKAELGEFVKLLPEISGKLYSIYVGNGQDIKGFPTQVATDRKFSICLITENDQLRLRKLHQIFILSELRGFILSLKASEDPQKAAARAVFHAQQYLQATRQGFLKKWNYHRKCDPRKDIRGETFSEFLGLFQGVIVNELQTNSVDASHCKDDCSAVDYLRIVRCYDAVDNTGTIIHCHAKPCNGILHACIDVGNVKTCEMNENSDRRFSWLRSVKDDTSKLLCPGRVVEMYRTRYKEIFHCSVCKCICAEQDGNSTAMRTISLIPQFADIRRNMVMTGVRFAEKDRMFHLQIEQAELGPFGEIVPDTAEWKELGDFQYDPAEEGSFSMKKGEEFVKLTEFIDFSFVTLDQRTINLDEIFADPGQVLIGVRFVFNGMDDAFELQIKSWPVNLETGKLAEGNPSDVEWIGWENSKMRSECYNRPRSTIDLEDANEPLRTNKWNEALLVPNLRLMIRATNFQNDLHQHTIPYLDLQPVTYSTAKIPLGGLQIFYKRVKGYGGFLAFRIFGFDFTEDFRWKMSTSQFNKYRPFFHENLILQESSE
ncbi:GSCOCG00013416001-RA-CDS [Cotesia congregata]|uniref:Uncharacterized protein n=1 Tax=Cotesia congregata TaxID=51543 RepID=A0A8J2H3Z6_COTCN|nr:GSCOCG00013416001-RA-CDS [Cotesia congregata]CAG5075842.1 Protein of unknown function [Cotesia congregata]